MYAHTMGIVSAALLLSVMTYFSIDIILASQRTIITIFYTFYGDRIYSNVVSQVVHFSYPCSYLWHDTAAVYNVHSSIKRTAHK